MSTTTLRRLQEEEVCPEGHIEVCLMTPAEGDIKTVFDPNNGVEVNIAREQFTNLVKTRKTHTAFKVSENGEQGDIMREFDVHAGKIIYVPVMQGG